MKKPSIRHHTRVHVPTLHKGLYSYNSINFESRVNSRYKPWFYFLFVEYTCIHISVSLATAKLITLTVNFPALWFHSFSKITCARNCVWIMKGRIKIHSPTKLVLHTKGSKQRCIYYLYVRINSVTIIVQSMHVWYSATREKLFYFYWR